MRLTSFELAAENLSWFIVNDGVMGGLSSGTVNFDDGIMTFSGEINTNGGGFTSVRVRIQAGVLADVTEIVLRARTDGRAYKLTLQDVLEGRDRRISHQGELAFGAGRDWQTAALSLSGLNTTIFGRSVQTNPLRPDLVNEIGLILSDGVDGPFEIAIDWIDACR